MGVDISLNFSDGTCITPHPNTLFVFIDDTGHELFRDPNYPVFGLGGCAILYCNFVEKMVDPWIQLKRLHFASKQIHASSIKNPSTLQMKALNIFFSTNEFYRFAVITSNQTKFYTRYPNIEIVLYSLALKIEKILSDIDACDIIFIFEDSKRLMPEIEKRSHILHFCKTSTSGNNIIPIHYCKMSKSFQCPGLEIADVIIHTAGTCVRGKNQGRYKTHSERLDFEAIFGGISQDYIQFIDVSECRENMPPIDYQHE